MFDFLSHCAHSMDAGDWVGILFGVLAGWSLYRAHKNQSMRDFNLFDLLMENGRVSKVACIFIATWAVCSWAFIKHTSKNGLDMGLLGAYGGLFVSPLVVRLFSPVPVVPPLLDPPKVPA